MPDAVIYYIVQMVRQKIAEARAFVVSILRAIVVECKRESLSCVFW